MCRATNAKSWLQKTSQLVLFFLFLYTFYFISMVFLDRSTFSMTKSLFNPLEGMGLNCSNGTMTCPANHRGTRVFKPTDHGGRPTCPDYFRWIYEDLRPWKSTGITEEMVERANRTANFRLVIVDGRAYVETYLKAFQTRDTFTLWGILQLLRRFPGKIPDLDLMFDCVDWPVVRSDDYRGPDAKAPPPLFRFCGDDKTLDIVFPDWSFWGWPETNIKPWERISKEITMANKRTRWEQREPYAYWKGNPIVTEKRMELLKCNVSDAYDWNARIYAQNWTIEVKHGFKNSSLASQCNHRYKIYIEGSAWSVSQKYILACDSVTLLVKPQYYDFFSRGLMPLRHYWPICEGKKMQVHQVCRRVGQQKPEEGKNSISIIKEKSSFLTHKSQTVQVEMIRKTASKFIQEELKMERVYDYMFHLLNEYARLLKYKPRISPKAVELCVETMVCPAQGLSRAFMTESLVAESTSDVAPCTMPKAYDEYSRDKLRRRKESILRQVEKGERIYWEWQAKKDLCLCTFSLLLFI